MDGAANPLLLNFTIEASGIHPAIDLTCPDTCGHVPVPSLGARRAAAILDGCRPCCARFRIDGGALFSSCSADASRTTGTSDDVGGGGGDGMLHCNDYRSAVEGVSDAAADHCACYLACSGIHHPGAVACDR